MEDCMYGYGLGRGQKQDTGDRVVLYSAQVESLFDPFDDKSAQVF